MKKTVQLLLVVIGLLFACPVVNAQSKASNKALAKECKRKKKEFAKEGWKVFATSRSIDGALDAHYRKLQNENVIEIVSFANALKKNNLMQTAKNNAANLYARSAGSYVKGRVVSDMGNNANDVSAEFDHFYAAYETLVEKEIKGELRESFSVIREVMTDKKSGQPIYEVQSFYIIDEDAASAARIRAFENAMRESAMAQQHAEMVSKFIQEGFAIEE
jgi:hypothetical protein